MEGDDVGCTYHLTTNQGNMAHHQASLNDNRRMVVTGRNNQVHFVGEVTGCIREKILLIKTHIDLTTAQYEDERIGPNDLPHQHLELGVI